ncbi:MAG: hypothetical protein ACO1SX_19145 [Actinomycetota bacterium]
MSTIPILWPELKVDAVTPAAVLRVQATSLEKLTRGILLGRVVGGEAGDQAYLHLDVVAPSLDTTVRMVTITHKLGFPYPAVVKWLEMSSATFNDTHASSDTQLERILEAALSSSGVMSAIHSLLARSNDVEPVIPDSSRDESTADEFSLGAPVE